MRYFQYTIIRLLCIANLLLFVCCNKGGERYKIGVAHNSNTEWHSQMNSEIIQEAKFYDLYDIEFLSADGDIDTQVKQIKEFIDANVDAIIITISDPTPLNSIINEARDKGITVVVYGECDNNNYTSCITVNSHHLGEAAGKKAASVLKKGETIVELKCIDNPLNSSKIADEIHDGFIEHLNITDNNVVSIEVSNDKMQVESAVDSLYKIYPKIDIFFAYTSDVANLVHNKINQLGHNDESSLWVIQTSSMGDDLRMIIDKKVNTLFIYPTGGNVILNQIHKIHMNLEYKRQITGTTTIADESNYNILWNQYWSIVRRNNQLDKLDARIVNSDEKFEQQKIFLLSISLFTIALFVLMMFILKILQIKLQKNRELSIQNDQISKQNMQLEVQRIELIRMSNSAEESTSQDSKFIDRVNEIIHKNMSDANFGVDQLCSELCYSRVQVYRKVKAMTGESPNKLIRIARIKRGDYLLRNTEKSITEIACEVGYISPSYFSKYYKEIYGVVPSDIIR